MRGAWGHDLPFVPKVPLGDKKPPPVRAGAVGRETADCAGATGLVHAVHAAHAAGGRRSGRVLLGDVGDHGFGHQQEAGDGGGVLEGAAGESGWERMPALSMSTYSPVATL